MAKKKGIPSENIFMDHAGFLPMKVSTGQKKFLA